MPLKKIAVTLTTIFVMSFGALFITYGYMNIYRPREPNTNENYTIRTRVLYGFVYISERDRAMIYWCGMVSLLSLAAAGVAYHQYKQYLKG